MQVLSLVGTTRPIVNNNTPTIMQIGKKCFYELCIRNLVTAMYIFVKCPISCAI